MKHLAHKPFFFSLILVLPLWIALGNFIIAAIVALLIAFLIAMCSALLKLKQADETPATHEPGPDEEQS